MTKVPASKVRVKHYDSLSVLDPFCQDYICFVMVYAESIEGFKTKQYSDFV